MSQNRVNGLVIRVTGHEVWVELGGEVVPCLLRGRLRQKGRGFHIVAGDRVEVSLSEAEGGKGAIEEVKARLSWLSRFTGGRDAVERVIVANVDILFLVVSIRDPQLHYGFVDRVLVSAERGHTKTWICLNKTDLARDPSEIDDFATLYSGIGYPVVKTNAISGDGVDELKKQLQGGVYAFVGQSGVGKSSLLNEIDETLQLKVSHVANKTGRGRHTTSFSQLYPVNGGYMADTPGMQTFGFPGTVREELAECFPEFAEYAEDCRFRPCMHSKEPDCAVKNAADAGRIHPSRFKSYLWMLSEIDERLKRKY